MSQTITNESILGQLASEDLQLVKIGAENSNLNSFLSANLRNFNEKLLQLEAMLAALTKREGIFKNEASHQIAIVISGTDERLIQVYLPSLLTAIGNFPRDGNTETLELLVHKAGVVLKGTTRSRANFHQTELQNCLLAIAASGKLEFVDDFLNDLAGAIAKKWQVDQDSEIITEELKTLFGKDLLKIPNIEEVFRKAAEVAVQDLE